MAKSHKSSTETSEMLANLLEVAEQLKNKYVIVEGKKDEEVLRSLGVENTVKIAQENIHNIPFTFNSNKEIVILTDFDKAGKKLAIRANNIFKAHKLKVNSHLRNRFMGLGKTRVEDFRVFISECYPFLSRAVLADFVGGYFERKSIPYPKETTFGKHEKEK